MEVPRLATFGAEADAGARTPVAWPSLSREPRSAESRRGEDEAHPRVRGLSKAKHGTHQTGSSAFPSGISLGQHSPNPPECVRNGYSHHHRDTGENRAARASHCRLFGVGAACPVAPSPGFENVEWYMSQPGAFTPLPLHFTPVLA